MTPEDLAQGLPGRDGYDHLLVHLLKNLAGRALEGMMPALQEVSGDLLHERVPGFPGFIFRPSPALRLVALDPPDEDGPSWAFALDGEADEKGAWTLEEVRVVRWWPDALAAPHSRPSLGEVHRSLSEDGYLPSLAFRRSRSLPPFQEDSRWLEMSMDAGRACFDAFPDALLRLESALLRTGRPEHARLLAEGRARVAGFNPILDPRYPEPASYRSVERFADSALSRRGVGDLEGLASEYAEVQLLLEARTLNQVLPDLVGVISTLGHADVPDLEEDGSWSCNDGRNTVRLIHLGEDGTATLSLRDQNSDLLARVVDGVSLEVTDERRGGMTLFRAEPGTSGSWVFSGRASPWGGEEIRRFNAFVNGVSTLSVCLEEEMRDARPSGGWPLPVP